jgi:hypothetical protein
MCLEDTARIPLRSHDGSTVAYALVDAADADHVNRWRWHLVEGYATRSGYISGVGARNVYMHRELLGLKHGDGFEGDHINLDNRRVNLRTLSKAGNRQNRPNRSGSRSIYRGVWWDKAKQRWKAEVKVSGKKIHLGSFLDEHEAGLAAHAGRGIHLPYATD